MFQGGDSDNWETDEEDEGYEYVAEEIEPPSAKGPQTKPPLTIVQMATPSEPLPVRPPRTKQKSPTASHSPSHLGKYTAENTDTHALPN